MDNDRGYLRKLWSKYFTFGWKFGLFLIVLFTIPRFIIALNDYVHGGGGSIFLLYILMSLVPFIFLNKSGRKYIGIKKPDKWIKLLYSFLAGSAFCFISYLITYLLFGTTIHNSFVYISTVFKLTPEMIESSKMQLYLMSIIVGMTFSPIGEELFYRGVIHGSFVNRFGENKASIIDSIAFMIAHLPHFGIIYYNGAWSFPVFPAFVWMFFMFTLSRLFFKCKTSSDSIWGAVLAHSGYNFMMMSIIYFSIY